MDHQPVAVPPDVLSRTQCALAAALWHYASAPLTQRLFVRGCIPDLDEPRVTVALWTGPAAREKVNLFLHIPLVSDGVLLSAAQVTAGLLRLGRGPYIFGVTRRRFDGKPVLNGSVLVEGVAALPSPGESGERQGLGEPGEPRGPRGFYFERPGQLKEY
ncbi:hypothetical protein [Streptomyces sp. NPDC087212]|uniref:hypothetical protein n=1 Tax=Streptomyces sp. NPDC087212 TaxID=3365766 RepID=UPI0037F1ADEE